MPLVFSKEAHMTTQNHPTKTFPQQPAWNSGAAIGAILGLAAGVVTPPNITLLSVVAGARYIAVAHVLAFMVIGTMVGGLMGFVGGRHAVLRAPNETASARESTDAET